MRSPQLRRLQTASFSQWKESIARSDYRRLCITVSGYEARARHWAESSVGVLPGAPATEWLVAGFTDFDGKLSRQENDRFYKSMGVGTVSCSSRQKESFLESVKEAVRLAIERAGSSSIEVHVDYSCMPRLWYCRLPGLLEQALRIEDRVFFWYSRGDYLNVKYRTAGTSDFEVFAGKPSLSPRFRTHLLGLGFDRIRSLSIWSVLDPQQLVCFYPDAMGDEDYAAKMASEYADIFARASFTCRLPMQFFDSAYSQLRDLIRDFGTLGDVVLVPDGPKPLVLASSLATLTLKTPGAVCFHVSRRRTREFTPVDVRATGSVLGFSFRGAGGEGTRDDPPLPREPRGYTI